MGRARPRPSLTVSRYVIREFMGLFLPIVAGFVLLYLIVDLFDRLNILLRHQATWWSAARYFAFKIPLMITQITPPAVLTSALLSLGMLSRRNEIIALRACGVSLPQTALPLLGLAAIISAGTLMWNETVVPYCTREYQYVNNVEIRKRPLRGILSDREIWYHGADGFYNINHIDARRETLVGLTIYRTDERFDLRRIVIAAAAHWTGSGWAVTNAVERTIGSDGTVRTEPVDGTQLVIQETLSDFLEVHREPEELSYLALRERIRELTRKGIDASNY
jgi:lipopolysaccharide export system permease protein